MARRDDREYREYLSEEQRRQPGCPARKVLLIQLIRATSSILHRPSGWTWSILRVGFAARLPDQGMTERLLHVGFDAWHDKGVHSSQIRSHL